MSRERVTQSWRQRARAPFEGQSSDSIAKINGLTKAVALLVKGMTRERFLQNGETVGILKRLKDGTSADFDCTREEGVGSKDQSPRSHESQD